MTLSAPHQKLAQTRLYEQETSLELLAAQYGLSESEMIDFSLNINPFGFSPLATEAVHTAMAEANRYPDLNLSALRAALAQRHGVPGDKLFFGAGLDDVIKLLIAAWARPSDKVLVHLPTFPRYALEAELHGCQVIGVPGIDAITFDVARYTDVLRSEKIAVAFICTPNNPTGEIIGNDVVERLAETFPETIFIVDEALINPLKEGAMRLVDAHDNVVVLRTFSKFFGLAGMRIGYAVGNEKLIEVANVGRPPFNVSLPGAAAAVAALQDGAFLTSCGKRFADEATFFRERIAQMPRLQIIGAHGNMMLLALDGLASADAAATLAAKGIVVADATSFDGLQDTATLRVSLKGRTENEQLVAALRAL